MKAEYDDSFCFMFWIIFSCPQVNRILQMNESNVLVYNVTVHVKYHIYTHHDFDVASGTNLTSVRWCGASKMSDGRAIKPVSNKSFCAGKDIGLSFLQ